MVTLISANFKCQILLQGISDATNRVICHDVTIKKSEKKNVPLSSLIFSLVTKMVLGLLKWLKETSSHDKNKGIIIKHELSAKGKIILRTKKGRVYEFADKWKVDIMDFWE